MNNDSSDGTSDDIPNSWGWRVLKFFLVVTAIVIFKLLFRSDSYSNITRLFNFSKPPIQITVRKGNIGGDVVQIINTSDDMLIIDYLTIYEGKHKSTVVSETLKPYEAKSFGVLEFNPTWKPQPGNKGFVAIRGYSKKLYFTLSKDSYNYKFISDIPADYPR